MPSGLARSSASIFAFICAPTFTTFTPDNTLMSIVKASLSLSRMAYVGRLAQPNWTRAMRLRVIFQTARQPSTALTRSEHSGFFRGEI
jgi:hypothetical protein